MIHPALTLAHPWHHLPRLPTRSAELGPHHTSAPSRSEDTSSHMGLNAAHQGNIQKAISLKLTVRRRQAHGRSLARVWQRSRQVWNLCPQNCWGPSSAPSHPRLAWDTPGPASAHTHIPAPISVHTLVPFPSRPFAHAYLCAWHQNLAPI